VRWRWLITGQVQGVGFRPFVYRIARELQLTGSVRNDGSAVVIECQGIADSLREFQLRLQRDHPTLMEMRGLRCEVIAPDNDQADFQIIPSSRGTAGSDVTVDVATCPQCVSDILSPRDRRFGYTLTTCTNCGPRYSIITDTPYDRCNTTMSRFDMCPACHAEYTDPSDRRFHAQPIACHECGPKLELVRPDGELIDGDPIALARTMLAEGKILAIKGVGGFHLAVRADSEEAVRRLRALKKRDFKPFALMVESIEEAQCLVELGQSAISAMQSPACPIVLAPRRKDAKVASSVSPGSYRLGVMLPYTPIQHLLFQTAPALVMTSGNISDEPLVIDNHEALAHLGAMSDAILWHDRPIQRAIDDSVLADLGQGAPIPLRRARGFVPRAIALPVGSPVHGICFGGELKNTITIVRGELAIPSQHLGDLTHPLAYEAFIRCCDDLRRLFKVEPKWIAHDLHPFYLSTTYATKLASELQVPRVAVQHHHAHAAALMAEHGIRDRILAVVCDGTGFGTDDTIWGGELLAVDLRDFRRLARLRPLRLPGGDAAARDTARCGLALLHQAYGPDFAAHPAAARLLPDPARRQILARMIRDNVACVRSSGAGRFFDGAAALLGLCEFNHYEAQAGLALESAAYPCSQRQSPAETRPLYQIDGDELREIDLSPLIRALVEGIERDEPVTDLAYLFHEQFAQAWAQAAIEASDRLGIRTVGLSGGVFCNAILTQHLSALLADRGLLVLRHIVAPPNDGGLSLGQAAVASARAESGLV
jgi:hydrogenase maturation protein HypF